MNEQLAALWADGSLPALLRWWAMFVLLGLAGTPVLAAVWPGSLAQAYTRSRWLTPLAVAWLTWLLASLGVVVSGRAAAMTVALLLTGTSLWLLHRMPVRPALRPLLPAALATELLWAVPFVYLCWVRAGQPDLIGLEKFMDFGFVNMAFASPTVPPPDPWYAGFPINYYYFGHYFTAVLCHLAQVAPEMGYQLMLGSLLGGTVLLSSTLIFDLLRRPGLHDGMRWLAAGIAGFWLAFGGNSHSFFYSLFRPVLVALGWGDYTKLDYFYPHSTRFVGFDPDTNDKLITEFPSYSFVVADLHAHLIGLPLYLLALHATTTLIGHRDDRPAWSLRLLCGGLLGMALLTNPWDVPGLGLLLTGAAAIGHLRHDAQGWHDRRWLLHSVRDGALFLALALLLASPFLSHFRSFAGGVGLVSSRTPLWQWLILYGVHVLLPLLGLLAVQRQYRRPLHTADHAMWLWGLGGLGLALLPEMIYLRDIYSGGYYRANTAFKFGYQAFVLLTLASSLAVAAILRTWTTHQSLRVLRSVGLPVLLLLPFSYAIIVLYAPPLSAPPERRTLDGLQFLGRTQPGDAAIARWLRQNTPPGTVILEATGDSYTDAGRISVASARPTVLGWAVHQWLWRGENGGWKERQTDVRQVYEAANGPAAAVALRKHGVRYIVIGAVERRLYNVQDEVLRSLGAVVLKEGDSELIEIGPAWLR